MMPNPDLKTAPYSQEAEQSVLGGIMIEDSAWDKVADCLRSEDFYHPGHRMIFQALSDLAEKNKPLDVLTVAERLKDCQQLDRVGGDTYLFELANNTPSIANIATYAELVHERSVLRQLIRAANDIADNALQLKGRDAHEVLDEAERKVFAIAEQSSLSTGPQRIGSVLAKAVERIDTLFHSNSAITGMATGYIDLDNMTAGLQSADLIIVAGRPSMGKTAFSLNLAEHTVIKEKKPVLVFSMEMPAEQLAIRMISSLGRIDQHHLRTGKLTDHDWPRITSTVALLSEAPLLIDDTPALNPTELRARARRAAREYGQLGLIIVDYLQLMQIADTSENRATEIAQISRSLKSLAKELNVPLIALSQLNRSLEQRADKRPVMSDLRESGSLEQDADLIMFIYRDEVYNDNSPDKGKAEIIIGKQRNGPIGKISLTFLGKYTRFENSAENKSYVPAGGNAQ
ncbi:MAG: replicative DNA helicase [Pseudomonadota bacterium]